MSEANYGVFKMEKQKLILIRNILFKTFLVSIVFAVILFVLTFVFWNKWCFITNLIFHISESQLGEMVINFFSIIRFYVIFILLSPAIALHLTVKALKE